jgi:hypothetical protein
LNKRSLISILLIICFSSFGQNELEKYIPVEGSSFIFHPSIEIKTVVHIIKKSETDAENMTEDSLAFINNQFEWINRFYKQMYKPVLLPANQVEYYIPDSRIKFKVDTILFHTDENDWDRIKTVLQMQQNEPIEMASVNLETNEITITGKWKYKLEKAKDSIQIVRAGDNNGVYSHSGIREIENKTIITLSQKLKSNTTGGIGYYTALNKNCNLDLWEKYTNSDKTALHVFYTGSSKSGIAFGCGPTPYYLNVSNLIKGGDWAGAQLTAHELGHTIGLRHTDRPQFDDLPASDKFGFIPCNSTKTSNNIMGYNQCRNYLSPKQIGYVHQLYSTKANRILLTTANEYHPEVPIEVWNDTIWNKAMVLRNDIIIRKGQTLTIRNQVHLPQGASIFIERGAHLIIDGAIITNVFGTGWQGIVFCKSYEKSDQLPCKKKQLGTIDVRNEGKLVNASLNPLIDI